MIPGHVLHARMDIDTAYPGRQRYLAHDGAGDGLHTALAPALSAGPWQEPVPADTQRRPHRLPAHSLNHRRFRGLAHYQITGRRTIGVQVTNIATIYKTIEPRKKCACPLIRNGECPIL